MTSDFDRGFAAGVEAAAEVARGFACSMSASISHGTAVDIAEEIRLLEPPRTSAAKTSEEERK
jgi:hypothetical protein